MKPSAAEVVADGGWSPLHARVLFVAGNGVSALAIIDSNGDGREITAERFWRHEDGRWRSGHSSGGVASTPSSEPIGIQRDDRGVSCAFGRAERPGPVVVEIDGREVEVIAGEGGWWCWLRPVVASE
ncbi:hypothetical protein ACWIGI_41220 [Nocardia sp. NPDC055321]